MSVPLSRASARTRFRHLLPALTLAALLTAAAAHAEPFEQVPGVQRLALDGLQVTALFDGVAFLPSRDIRDTDPARNRAWLRADWVPQTEEGVQTAVNAYLVSRGSQLLLVDAGTADCFGPRLGQVLQNLRAAGVRPEDIANVLLTHAHPDHLCGVLASDGTPAFPNATLWLAGADARFWLSASVREQAPAAVRPIFDMTRRAVQPYQDQGRLRSFAPGDPLPPGVQAIDSHGHTPGHTSWLIQGLNGAPALLVWGDVVHYHAVQFRDPSASYEFDTNRREAIASRRRLLERAAHEGWMVAGAHLPFPGTGHVRRDGSGYRWLPTEFGPLTP